MTEESSEEDTDSVGSSPTEEWGKPGQITVKDKTSNEEETGEIEVYECPFCEFDHPNERMVRLHITRLDDADHRNRNAFLDNLYIQAVDAEGNVVEDIESPRGTDFEGEDRTELLPDNVDPDSRQGEILLEALKRPAAPEAEIVRAVYGETGNGDSYVNKVLRRHAANRPTPDMEENGSSGYNDLTDLQQEIVDAAVERVANGDAEDLDDLTWTRVAEDADCAIQTVSNTLKGHEDIFNHRLARKTAAEELNGPTRGTANAASTEMPEVAPSSEVRSAVENLKEVVEDTREEHEQQLETVVERLAALEESASEEPTESDGEGVVLEPEQWTTIVRCCTSTERLDGDEILTDLIRQIE